VRVGGGTVELCVVGDREGRCAARPEAVRRVEVASQQSERTPYDGGMTLGVDAQAIGDHRAPTGCVADDVDEVVRIFGLAAVTEGQRLEDDKRRGTADRGLCAALSRP